MLSYIFPFLKYYDVHLGPFVFLPTKIFELFCYNLLTMTVAAEGYFRRVLSALT